MPRGKSAASVRPKSRDFDSDEAAERELKRLQRQYRIMERDQQAYKIQAEETLRKQRLEISKLSEEQDELLRKLKCCSQKKSDTQSIQALLEQRKTLDDQIENERQVQIQLDKEIKHMEKTIFEQRKKEVAASQSHTSQARNTQKATRTLEKKLDGALILYNKQLTKNSQLREEIETLYRERVRFQELYRRLDKVLQDVRKNISDTIDRSTTAYDAREEAQTKMTMLKKKASKDFAQYSAEMKELERVIAHERRLKAFMTTKNKERTTMDDGQEMRCSHEMKEQKGADGGELDTLEEVFEQIKRLTGEDNLEVLVAEFIEGENRNFALFNFVNDQNTEAETLREQIQQTREELDQLQIQDAQKEREKQVALKELMDLQQECQKQTQTYEAQANDISKILDHIKIDRVLDKSDCDRTMVLGMGSSSGITNSNIMTSISLVEQKINDMLMIQAFIKSKDLEKSSDLKEIAQFLLGQKPDVQGHEETVQPLITRHDYEAEDYSLIDEEDRPLTKKEHCQKIMSSVVGKDRKGRVKKNPKSNTMPPRSLEY